MMGRVLGPARSGFEPLLLSLLAGGPFPYPNSGICHAHLTGMSGRLTTTWMRTTWHGGRSTHARIASL